MPQQLMAGDTLAPPMFPHRAAAPSPVSRATSARPFGLSRAVPVRPVSEVLPRLTLCPERQINVTEDGEPFAFAPRMASSFTTTAQTQEDHQLDEETTNDTD